MGLIVDTLIIGAGGAGLTTALKLKENGVDDILIVSKTYPTASQTSQAQGGINAVLDNKIDSIEAHIEDTFKSSHKLGDKDTISYMCKQAPYVIKWLDNLGVSFSRDKDNKIAQRYLGGAKYKRACYSSDYTGIKIIHTLYDSCIKNNIKFLNEYMLLSLIIENNTIKGVTVLELATAKVHQILASKVILATGGYGGIYYNHTTNSTATTADGIICAYKAGVKLSNMEFIQFHPTALKNSCILIGESARGEGGYLITQDGKRFTDELQPRDIVSREIYKKILDNQEVFLDLRDLGEEKIKELLPQEYDIVKQFANKELDKEPISIVPAAHYSMGGIDVDIDGKTNIKNLFAVGECANNKVHGANRLGGNSLLEIIAFGLRVADVIGKTSKENIIEKEYKEFYNDKQMITELLKKESSYESFYIYKDKVGDILFKNVGIFRSKESLEDAIKQFDTILQKILKMGISDKSYIYNTELKEFLEFQNILLCAKIVAKSALDRDISCGAHYRIDGENL